MKKPWLKRTLLTLLVFVHCHSMEAGWRDWWNSLKAWATQIWANWWKKPETQAAAKAGAAIAFQQQQAAAQPISPQEKVNQAIVTFVKRAEKFASDLKKANLDQISFEQLYAGNEAIMHDIDTIRILGIPQSIENQLKQITNTPLERQLVTTFGFLKSPIPTWSSLKDIKSLQATEFSAEQINGIANDLAKRYHKTSNRPGQFDDYIQNLKKLAKDNPTSQTLHLPEYIPMQDILDAFRRFKIRLANSEWIHGKTFANNIEQIYSQGLIQTSNPADVSAFK